MNGYASQTKKILFEVETSQANPNEASERLKFNVETLFGTKPNVEVAESDIIALSAFNAWDADVAEVADVANSHPIMHPHPPRSKRSNCSPPASYHRRTA